MTRNKKFGIGAVLLVGAIGYLVYAGVQQSSVYYFTISEFQGRKDTLGNHGVRVAGRVAAGSVQKQTTAKGTQLKFVIRDMNAAEGDGGPQVAVEFAGVQPDMFGEGRDVIVEGKYADGILRAQTVMTSCPSKYEPTDPNAAPAQAAAR